MFKLLWGFCKIAAVACVALVLGSWIRWDGTTISDHIRSGMSHAERRITVEPVGLPSGEKILTTERQKLRDLIKELNTPSTRTGRTH